LSADEHSDDGTFDYETLAREEIEYAIEHIDPQVFPKNLANARAALEARQSGKSPEPLPLLEAKTDVAYTLWVERFLGAMVILYATLGLIYDDLMLPGRRKYLHQFYTIHLHGWAAWIGALGLLLIAAVPILGGLDQSDPPIIRAQFRLVFRLALVVLVIAIAVQAALRIT
jgi:hypothetical protein